MATPGSESADSLWLGRFLKGIIQDLLRWHLDENAFEQDSQTKSGGETVYLPGFLTNFTSATKGVPDKSLRTTWTIFQNLFRKWNRRVAMVSKYSCFFALCKQVNANPLKVHH